MKSLLSKDDLNRWLVALENQPASSSELIDWIEGPLRAFFPFERLVCAFGELVAGEIKMTAFRAVGHQPDYLRQLAGSFELAQRGSLAWWLAHREPFVIDPDNPPPYATAFEVAEIREFDLRNVAGHGVLNEKSNSGVYLGFVGVETPVSDWHLAALRIIAPVLCDLVVRDVALERKNSLNLSTLTPRQIEIVRLLASGANDKVIGRTLGISEKTVRNQLSDIYLRAGIHKRTELIARLR
jgi:DNA-binding CsgD family transcriptional regulator